ncbi:hypothetical protein J4E85_010515 [Alternaria conjuncta]|uniref:uncharacterized protein n=1 Tax=Alternaria conjuncta TaxID=181017 RepID=UPI0022205153|nr:uncharacterized protein J4E85_010515 [Alternaria conjuncta]KAI4914452.1 hypothetical protein J4E85_010515 [Alternaria conjuncta]
MSQPSLSPSLTLLDSEITYEQPASPATALSDHSDETGITHKEPSSGTAASDHSDDTDDTESTHEEPSSPVTAPSDHSDGTVDAADAADAADTKALPTKDETKEPWYDSQANGNLRLQVLTWDGKACEVPKNECKKSKKSAQAE